MDRENHEWEPMDDENMLIDGENMPKDPENMPKKKPAEEKPIEEPAQMDGEKPKNDSEKKLAELAQKKQKLMKGE